MFRTDWVTSLRYKLLAPLLVAGLVFGLSLQFILLPQEIDAARDVFRVAQQSALTILKPALAESLLKGDLVQAYAALDEVNHDFPHWLILKLTNLKGQRLYPFDEPQPLVADRDIVWLEQEMKYQDTVLGTLTVAADPAEYLKAATSRVQSLKLLMLLLAALTGAVFVWLQARIILRPLQRLAAAADRLAQGDFSAALPPAARDEVGGLVSAFDAMRKSRKAAEDALRGSEQSLVLALSASQTGMWEWNTENGTTYYESNYRKLLGYGEHDLPMWDKLIHRDDIEGVIGALNRHLDGFEPNYSSEHRKRNASGVWEWVSEAGQVVERDAQGWQLRILGTLHLITERKETEAKLVHAAAAEAANIAKSAFLATMSHEIRTPLNGVTGFLHLLAETKLDEQQKDYLRTIDFSAQTLLAVINDVLDFSKIEAGKLSIEYIDVDMRELIEAGVAMYAANAENKQLDLVCIVDKNLPMSLRADPTRLMQVLGNLVGNAIKFTEQGEVLVEVQMKEDTATDVLLELRVSDTGIGISDEALSRLFQPFSQADASTTRKYGGTGLGLIIAKRLTEMMGGSIDVASQVGRGTCFSLQLRLRKATDAVGHNLSRPGVLAQRRILIVTPNPRVARGLGESFALWGIAAQFVDNGRAAIMLVNDAAKTNQIFDAVIFDHATQDIRAQEFAALMTSDAHLLLLANLATLRRAEDVERAGFIGRISKPAKSTELFSELRKLFSDGEVAATAEVKPEYAHQPLSGKRILIVDDNDINQKLAQLLVANLGAEFDSVENGTQAVEAATRRSYDAILMDVNMPVMDGLEATQRIRAFEAGGRSTPIIALTANALEGDRERFIAAGMDDYLSKPMKQKALLSVLNKWFACEAIPRTLVSSGAPNPPLSKFLPAPAHAATAELAALDPNLGVELSYGNRDTWLTVLSMLLEQLPEYARSLSQAAEDRLQLQTVAHRLAGASSYCGTPALHVAARQVETFCAQDKFAQAREVLPKLLCQIERLLQLDAVEKLAGRSSQ